MQAFGEREFERRLGVDRPLFLLTGAHAARDDVDVGVFRLNGNGEGKAHFNAAVTSVWRAHQKGRQRHSLRPRAVFAAHEVGLRPLERDRLKGIGEVDRRRECRLPRDALGKLHRLARSVAAALRIGELDGMRAGKGVRHAVHRDFLADDALRAQRERGADTAFARLFVGVGGKTDVGDRHMDFGAAARLRRLGRDVDAEGNEPLERTRLLPAHRKNAEKGLPFHLQLARRTRNGRDVYRLRVLQDVSDALHFKVVFHLGRALGGMRDVHRNGIAPTYQVAARKIVKGLLPVERNVRPEQSRDKNTRALPPRRDVFHRKADAHRLRGDDALVLRHRRKFNALLRTADVTVGVLIDNGKERAAIVAHFPVSRLRPRKMRARVRRKHRLRLGETAFHRRLRPESEQFPVAAECLRLRLSHVAPPAIA